MDTEVYISVDFHVSWNIVALCIYFQPLKNVQTILNLWAVREQVDGWIWPTNLICWSLGYAHSSANASYKIAASCYEFLLSMNVWSTHDEREFMTLLALGFIYKSCELHMIWNTFFFLFISSSMDYLPVSSGCHWGKKCSALLPWCSAVPS